MRIISQNKRVDLFYDGINIISPKQEEDKSIILGCAINLQPTNEKNWIRLGTYNDNNEAVSVLEKLHEAYVNGNKVFYMP